MLNLTGYVGRYIAVDRVDVNVRIDVKFIGIDVGGPTHDSAY